MQCIPSRSLARQNNKADKWYAGALFGLNSKTTHNRFMSNANGSAGLRVGYEQTRVFGYMGEVTFFTGDVKFGASKCIIKAINADLMATVNFAPLFYKSTTRRSFFEPRFFAGFGVNHICGYPSGVGNNNDLISKLGLDLGFNVGRNRHVYVFLQPAINYNLDHYSRTQYNNNYSALQIAAGNHGSHGMSEQNDLYIRKFCLCTPDSPPGTFHQRLPSIIAEVSLFFRNTFAMSRQIVCNDSIAAVCEIFRKSGIALAVLCHTVNNCDRPFGFFMKKKNIISKFHTT